MDYKCGKKVDFSNKTLAELFFKSVEENRDKKAIWCDGEEMKYGELGTLVCKYANYLLNHGVVYGDIIGIPMNNSIESVALIMASGVIGAGIAPINPTIPIDAVDIAFRAANVRHLIARKAFYKGIKDKKFDYLTGCKLCLDGEADGADSFHEVLKQPDKKPEYGHITGRETLILTMTSGSTGKPKPIELTQENKLKRAEAHIKLYDITPEDNILAATPLYHSLAERLVIIPLLIGGTSVLLPRFTPVLWLNCIKDQKVTFTIAVSAQLSQIAQLLSSPFVPEMTSLRSVVSSSALLEPYVRSELIKKLNCDFHEMYGTSECSTVTSINFREAADKQHSVGRPLPGVQLKIVNENGQEAGMDETGEILVKTPLRCAGYYQLPDMMEEAAISGFFRTGDMGKVDGDGYLYFSGRKKELIITGGVNVYPQDIENKLIKLEAVEECAAFPYADERLGEVVALAIVVKKGMELTRKQIQIFCAKNMADFQQPHKIFTLDRLPHNSMGKLTKMDLPKIVAGMEEMR